MDQIDVAMEAVKVDHKESDYYLRIVEPYELRDRWVVLEPLLEQLYELYEGRETLQSIIRDIASGDYTL